MARVSDKTARVKLLSAAEAEFALHGLLGAKVENIAHRAGLSKGAFYLHFEKKEDVFVLVVEAFLARLAEMQKPPNELSNLPEDAREMIAFWLDRDAEMFEFLWQNRPLFGMVTSCQGPHAYLFKLFHTRMRKTCGAWIDLLKDRGLFDRAPDTELTSTLLCGAYQELSRTMLALPKKPDIRTWVRQAWSIFLCGLGTPKTVSAWRVHTESDPRVIKRGLRPRSPNEES